MTPLETLVELFEELAEVLADVVDVARHMSWMVKKRLAISVLDDV